MLAHPYYVLAFPGAIWYDTVQQVLQWEGKPNAITSGAWSDQHPVFDTLIFGLFYQLGDCVGSLLSVSLSTRRQSPPHPSPCWYT